MCKDDFRRHAAEDKRHGQTEEDESVIAEERRVRGVEPCANGKGVDCHWGPFEEDGGDGKVLPPAGLDDVADAGGHVRDEEREEEDGDPDVEEGVLAEDVGVACVIGYAIGPDLWAVVAGE